MDVAGLFCEFMLRSEEVNDGSAGQVDRVAVDEAREVEGGASLLRGLAEAGAGHREHAIQEGG
jgi:hypothetical protein